jgi:hypothetical protein
MNKECTKCNETKLLKEFYEWHGVRRSECKDCYKKQAMVYQRKEQVWKKRTTSVDGKVPYMTEYYRKNKEKFAEYQRRFKEKNPDYFKQYQRSLKALKEEKV